MANTQRNDDFSPRLRALRRKLRRMPLYVSALPNIRYLTGFSGSAGHLLVEAHKTTLFTDGRYEAQVAEETSGIDVEISFGDSRPGFAEAVRARRVRELGFEHGRIGYETFAFLREQLSRVKLTPLVGKVEDLRMIKSAAEIEAIRRSAKLNSQAFESACAAAKPSWSEQRLAAEIDYKMRRLGAESTAFPTIVAAGNNGAKPHARPGADRMGKQRLVVIDQGAILAGYASDMTRMISFGRPEQQQIDLFRSVFEAQQAAVEAIRPAVEFQAVDRAARDHLKGSFVNGCRLDRVFPHSTGHGVGLEVHEMPRIAPKQRRRLKPGMVVTVEPGAYIEGLGGVRIEDLVLVTEDGHEVLTKTSRDLLIND